MLQGPSLIKEVKGGSVSKAYKEPKKLLKAMFSWLEGDGGILAMLRMQANGKSPVTTDGATPDYKVKNLIYFELIYNLKV